MNGPRQRKRCATGVGYRHRQAKAMPDVSIAQTLRYRSRPPPLLCRAPLAGGATVPLRWRVPHPLPAESGPFSS